MKILFVCHGNICRSVMAEMIMKQLIAEAGLAEVEVDSCATSTEEIGNDIYPPAQACLRRHGVPFTRHYARQITRADYARFDVILCMEQYNIRNLKYTLGAELLATDSQRFVDEGEALSGAKIRLLQEHDVADPWYTGDFETTYRDIVEGCEKWLQTIRGTVFSA